MSNNSVVHPIGKSVVGNRRSFIDLVPCMPGADDFEDKLLSFSHERPDDFGKVQRFVDSSQDQFTARTVEVAYPNNSTYPKVPNGDWQAKGPFEGQVRSQVRSVVSRSVERPRYPRSLRSFVPSICFYLLVLAAGFIVSMVLPFSVVRMSLLFLGLRLAVSVPIALLPAAFVLVKIVRRIYDSYLEMGANHIRLIQGRSSFRKRKVEIGYDSIAFVSVVQSLSDRLLRIGTVKIGRYNDEEAEIALDGVANPHRLSKMIKATLENRHNYEFVAMAS